MRILQLIYESPGSPFGFGGAGIRAEEIYKRLRERHDITLLCMKYPGARDGDIGGLRHLFVGTESSSLAKSVFSYTVSAANFVRRHGGEFDIIVENFLPSTPFFARFLTKAPVILQIQDYWGTHTFRRYPFRYALPMFFMEKCYPKLYSQLLFVSDVTRERFDLGGNAATVPNGIDSRLLGADAEEGSYILFISSIDLYKKGIDVLFGAFAEISPWYRDLSLMVAGSGRDMSSVKTELERLPFETRRRIKLPGWVSGDDKTALISKALFVVLPSRHESQPLNILEAAACGKPVIVSDIPELVFVSSEGLGLTFPSGSAEGLAERMKTLLGDVERRLSMGARGREFAAKFLWDDIATKFEDVLKHTVENFG